MFLCRNFRGTLREVTAKCKVKRRTERGRKVATREQEGRFATRVGSAEA
jgi:hypothetical protein